MKVKDARALTPGTALTTKEGERVTYVGYAFSPPMTFGPCTVLLEVRRTDGRLYFGLRPRDVEIEAEPDWADFFPIHDPGCNVTPYARHDEPDSDSVPF